MRLFISIATLLLGLLVQPACGADQDRPVKPAASTAPPPQADHEIARGEAPPRHQAEAPDTQVDCVDTEATAGQPTAGAERIDVLPTCDPDEPQTGQTKE